MAFAWLVLACTGPDSDLDGLTDRVERGLGTDPERADTDDDGLDDGEEVVRGTDPLRSDSDDDGYLDGDEVHEDTDPRDPESRIYYGGWPYNRHKADITDGTWQIDVGERPARVRADDQHSESVELYDYAGHDRDVLVTYCAVTNRQNHWCDATADWLYGRDGYGADGPAALEAVLAGDLLWVTVIGGGEAHYNDVVAFAERHPKLPAAVLFDREMEFRRALEAPRGVTMWLFDDDLSLVVGRSDKAFDEAGVVAIRRLRQGS